MKGYDLIKVYLEKDGPLTVEEGEAALPYKEVDRAALIKMLLEYREKLKAYRPASTTQQPVSPATTAPPSAEASTDGPTGVQSEQSHGDSSRKEEKPEEERLCPSMWGTKACMGKDVCPRKHLDLCVDPVCYGNEEHRKSCASGPNS